MSEQLAKRYERKGPGSHQVEQDCEVTVEKGWLMLQRLNGQDMTVPHAMRVQKGETIYWTADCTYTLHHSDRLEDDEQDRGIITSQISSHPPSRGLEGKVAIVTGAGCAGEGIGNGRAISIMLAEEGCNVLCLDLNLEWAQKTVEMATAISQKAKALPLKSDVTKAVDCEAAVEAALKEFGRLDILVNNVGIGGATGTAIDVDMEAWAKGLEINVSSMVQMAKYCIPAMQKNDGEIRGSIVNMGSVAGLRGGTPHLLYPTSKGAVVNMTRAMAAHHAPDGIRVNCVCPGMLYTPMMYARGMSDEAREARRKRSLLGTEGNGWDAACAVTFLASDHARWITGAILPVDAGSTAAVGIGMPKSASVNG